MTELGAFYDGYIAAFNACDHERFAGFFHPPVTVLHATRYDERPGADRNRVTYSARSSG